MSTRCLVDPWGVIHQCEGDGLYTGNRGQRPDPAKSGLLRRYDDWRYCERHWLVDWGPRPTEQPTYTRLFFLDEPTALAAGHRPCWECLRRKYKAFVNQWRTANHELIDPSDATIDPIDAQLHKERLNDGSKMTFPASLNQLPDGAFFQLDKKAFLKWRGLALEWSMKGYVSAADFTNLTKVHVLTPASVIKMLPAVQDQLVLHPTALRLSGVVAS